MKTFRTPLMMAALMMAGSSLHAAEFDAALVQALATSNLLKAEVAEKDVLAARRALARTAYLPQVLFEYESGQAKVQRNGGAWLEGTARTGTFSLTQPLVNVAALQAMGGAKKRFEGGEEGVRARRQEVLLDATEAYADLAEAQGIVRLYERDVARLAQHVRAEEARFTAGVNTRTDIQRAMSRLAEAQADLSRAQGQVAAAEALYVKRMGQAPEGGMGLPPFPEKVPTTLEDALARARQNNADMAAARLETAAAGKELRAAVKKKDIVALIRIGHNFKSSGAQVGAMPLAEAGKTLEEMLVRVQRKQEPRVTQPEISRQMQQLLAVYGETAGVFRALLAQKPGRKGA